MSCEICGEDSVNPWTGQDEPLCIKCQREQLAGVDSAVCSSCNKKLEPEDRFCSNCGQSAEACKREQITVKDKETPTSNALSCPKCEATAYGRHGGWIWFFAIILFPIGLVLLLLNKTYTCSQCHYTFRQ